MQKKYFEFEKNYLQLHLNKISSWGQEKQKKGVKTLESAKEEILGFETFCDLKVM